VWVASFDMGGPDFLDGVERIHRRQDCRRFEAMLILTRRIGESLNIGDEVSVTVLEVKGNQVRLGVAAPKSVAVHREEVFHRIAEENQPPADSPVSRTVRVTSKRGGGKLTGT